jgi:hypothetical protein
MKFIIGNEQQILNFINMNELQEIEPGTLSYYLDQYAGRNVLYIIKTDDNLQNYDYEGEVDPYEFEEEKDEMFNYEPQAEIIDLTIQNGGKLLKRKKLRKTNKSKTVRKSRKVKSKKLRKTNKSKKLRKTNKSKKLRKTNK